MRSAIFGAAVRIILRRQNTRNIIRNLMQPIRVSAGEPCNQETCGHPHHAARGPIECVCKLSMSVENDELEDPQYGANYK
jgi:hypothetical protein